MADTDSFLLTADIDDPGTLIANAVGYGWAKGPPKMLCVVLRGEGFLAVGYIKSRAQMEAMIESMRKNGDIVWGKLGS